MKMRLARALAISGVSSRRKAEELIKKGKVFVNGLVVKNVATNVDPDHDEILANAKPVHREKKEYFLLNKPRGVISAAQDSKGKKTVVDYIPSKGRMYPVGRLDKDTTGAIVITNDGDLAHKLMHPKFGIKRVYRARVKGQPTPKALERLRIGMQFGKRYAYAAKVRVIKQGRDVTDLELTLKEGWKHEVKVLCATVGYPVVRLERIRFAGLTTRGMGPGDCRRLTKPEVKQLYDEAKSET